MPPETQAVAALYADRFWDGVSGVRARLTKAIQAARKEFGFTNEAIDHICGFGKPQNIQRRPPPHLKHITAVNKKLTPTSAEFENNPDLMRSEIFSLASVLLNLKVDQVLPLNLSPHEKNEIAKEMERVNGCAQHGVAGPDVREIPLQDQAEVYVLLKAMQEIDKES